MRGAYAHGGLGGCFPPKGGRSHVFGWFWFGWVFVRWMGETFPSHVSWSLLTARMRRRGLLLAGAAVAIPGQDFSCETVFS